MRVRLFVLIAVCILLDVLVARKVKQYDVQSSVNPHKHTKHKQVVAASGQDHKARERIAGQQREHGATAC